MKSYIKQNISIILILLVGLLSFNSCVDDEFKSDTEPQKYLFEDVKSYADQFEIFWKVMDSNYNYFYEQKRTDGKDWGDIYREFYPKFKALKTYKRSDEFSDEEIRKEADLVIEYFTEIVDPIIDRHYALELIIQLNKETNEVFTFRGGMKNRNENSEGLRLLVQEKFNFMPKLLVNSDLYIYRNFGQIYFQNLIGSLKDNEDIYYLSFNQFNNINFLHIELEDKYFETKKELYKSFNFTFEDYINLESYKQNKNEEFKKVVGIKLKDLLDSWREFYESDEMNRLNQLVDEFNKNEKISQEFIDLCEIMLSRFDTLKYAKSRLSFTNEEDELYFSKNDSYDFIDDVNKSMGNFLNIFFKVGKFRSDINQVINAGYFYKNFLNPLHEGKIKKLIIDHRGNGGGAVMDFRFLMNRFVTKEALWGYQRTKQGSGRTSYTPWVPIYSQIHKFGIPKDIPIVVLTDKRSASMSEMTTLSLKSQSNQVISIGDYSAGATAGITSNADEFNGGRVGVISDVMYFYMPTMATKTAEGEVIEGVGLKPDIYVPSLTVDEVKNLVNKSSIEIEEDRALDAAVKYLKTK